jgi:hypothetical protein
MACGKQTSANLSAPKPTFFTILSMRSRDPGEAVQYWMSALAMSLRYSSKLIKNARPKLRHKGTFVDSINEFRIHGLLLCVRLGGLAAQGKLP